MDERAGREPRSGDRAETGLRDLLGLYRPLHSFAVLRLRLRVRRVPGQFALWPLRAFAGRLCRTVSRDAVGWRLEVLFRATRPLRPRREGPGLLEDGPLGD